MDSLNLTFEVGGEAVGDVGDQLIGGRSRDFSLRNFSFSAESNRKPRSLLCMISIFFDF
jgi:hypothetical protein